MSERFDDSPELFGDGCGGATYGDVDCQVCGEKYNVGEDERGVYDGEGVRYTNFAGLCVCECCFAKIESEVYRRMPQILKWYRGILEKRRKTLERDEKLLADACRRATTLEADVQCLCGAKHLCRFELPPEQSLFDSSEPIEMTCTQCGRALKAKMVLMPGARVEAFLLTPDGHINNCALASGDEEKNCQVCGGGPCPDSKILERTM